MKIYKDFKYGKLKNQDADLLLPEDPKNLDKELPLVVLVHGGAWVTGNKEGFQEFAEKIVDFGYAVWSLNYRLVPDGATCKDMLEDIDAGIKYILKEANKWKIKVDAIAMSGCSAGAHLALLYAYKQISPVPIKLIYNMVGPSDLTDISLLKHVKDIQMQELLGILSYFTGADFSSFNFVDAPKGLAECSPVTYITKDAPKTISSYGKLDTTVPYVQGIALDKKLREVVGENSSELYIYENSGHSLADDKDTDDFVMNRVKEELNRLLPI